MNELISIIVPVFNIKDYLTKCVESLVNQTYKNTEIILVDDGSTDGSELLCEKLKSTSPSVKAYHKKNGGLSDARNYGITKSSGQYITFVDGDDYLHPKACEILYRVAKDFNAKLVVGGLMIVDDKDSIIKEPPLCSEVSVRSYEDALKLVFDGKGYSACGKLYAKELFDDIIFPVGKIDEDFATVYKLFIESKEIVYSPDYIYYYYKRHGSITKSGFNKSKLDFVYNAIEAANYIKNNVSNAELHDRANAYLCRRIDSTIRLILNDNNSKLYTKELKDIVRLLRSYRKNIFASPFIGKKNKALMMLDMINPKLVLLKNKVQRQKKVKHEINQHLSTNRKA